MKSLIWVNTMATNTKDAGLSGEHDFLCSFCHKMRDESELCAKTMDGRLKCDRCAEKAFDGE